MVSAKPETENRLSQSLEDYLETIYLIQLTQSVARIKDIALKMGVSSPSVTGAIKSLKNMGLVEHSSYGYVELNDKGRKTADEIFKIHKALTEFLHKVLGLNPEKAEADACRIEHVLEPETAKRIVQFLDFAVNPSRDCEGCALEFNKWHRKENG